MTIHTFNVVDVTLQGDIIVDGVADWKITGNLTMEEASNVVVNGKKATWDVGGNVVMEGQATIKGDLNETS